MNEVEAIINGDEFIFEQVYHQYNKKMYFFLLRYTRSDDDACELVQQSFIKFWNSRKTLSPNIALSRQLFQVGKSCLIDHFRAQAREAKHRKDYSDQVSSMMAVDTAPEREFNQLVMKAMDQLPPGRREVFAMSRIENMSHREIADRLSLSVKTVESQIYKALKQLRKTLTQFLMF